ncbi:unnamed protein product [Mycetohabitans rhizoxinica HKI 454]|uniref:Uncharacterized protein n=1 Tax=Mycetohabitans rhizoxinica (strain DSM 19002 / CIP 109453 / HKI 454) TaxID=882378 RepID=E5AQ51_MYCRK|nr:MULTISPECIES: hypothetical protein [Mycetohabitans]CBW74733.1 unnamed protein product [Mycetohabitans rhizoxinica HKI 454]
MIGEVARLERPHAVVVLRALWDLLSGVRLNRAGVPNRPRA